MLAMARSAQSRAHTRACSCDLMKSLERLYCHNFDVPCSIFAFLGEIKVESCSTSWGILTFSLGLKPWRRTWNESVLVRLYPIDIIMSSTIDTESVSQICTTLHLFYISLPLQLSLSLSSSLSPYPSLSSPLSPVSLSFSPAIIHVRLSGYVCLVFVNSIVTFQQTKMHMQSIIRAMNQNHKQNVQLSYF